MIKKIKDNIFIVLLLVSIPSFFVLLNKGFYEPHDLHHFADIYEMIRAIGSGQLPPRLGPDFSYGFGYPLFNYYYVFPFYLGAFFWFMVGSVTLSYKLVMISAILTSIIGMYLFLRELTGKFPAFVGSVLYLYTPYRAVQLYVRGAIGEVWIMALIPFVGWSLLRLIKKPNLRLIAVSSFITSLLILSHNYLSFLSLPAVGVILLPYILKSKNKIKIFSSLILMFLISLGISAYWWFPALKEQGLVSATTPFPLIDHFPFLKQLILPSWGYGASLWGPGDGLSFQIGVVNLVVILVFGVVVFLTRKKINKNILYVSLLTLLGFVVAFSFMNVRTYPIWKLIPFYDFIQFPWRLLIYITFDTAVASALLVEVIPGKLKLYFGYFILILCFLLTVGYFHPSKIFYKTDNDYLARFFANRSTAGQTPGVSKAYVGYSEDYLLLPKWVDERPKTLPSSKIIISGGQVEDIQEITPVKWTAKVSATNDTTLTFNAFYFPGWEATVDSKQVDIKPGKPNGQIEFNLPKGNHAVKIWFGETKTNKIFDYVSLSCLLACIFFVVRKGKVKA